MGKKNLEQSYKVKDLLEYKLEKGREYFLVWWQGYPKKEATWEPRANVQGLFDFQLYYRTLKQKYQRKNIPNPPKEESNHQSSLKQHSSKLSKHKKISKLKKQQNKQQSRSVERPPLESPPIVNYLIEEPKEVVTKSSKKVSEVLGIDPSEQQEIKRKLQQSSAVKFQIKIKQFKQLPLIGQRIKRIGQSFMRGGKMMYQVQLQNKAMSQPVILHQNYIKLLWPRQFAEHLISKIRP